MSGYQVIYADPAWSYRDRCNAGKRGAAHKYQTMTDEEIYAMPVHRLAAPDSVLFLWATYPKLAEALRCISAWGFRYKTQGFTWIKMTRRGTPAIGMGHGTRANAELCLRAVRGKGLPRADAGVSSVILAPRGRHSEKPAETRDRIVRLYGDLPRVELFARQRIKGWDAWGNEIDSDLELDPAEWRRVPA